MPHFQVDLSNIEVGNTWNNAALISGGAIFADDSSSSIPAIEYTHKVADDVPGPCFLQFGDEFTIVKVCSKVMRQINSELSAN